MKKVISIILIFTSLTACGKNANRNAFSIGTGLTLGGLGYILSKDPGVTMAGLSTGLALGKHIGKKFDEVNALKQEVLNLNADKERSKFTKIDEESNQPVTIEIEPIETTKDYLNRHCRQYDYAYTKNGITSHGKGTACLNQEGIWQELHHENG